ncbi:uncharacterized protein LOC120218615 [Hibiscus syriacus]|uniref:uncharacterized protein LOC120218615 n=1 Tax=Hibiscus syriacus TaxID=106335 RepID=UPI001924560B|nr:uncharacterized protein LOC120218615 [Hibiscus syriacus]
MEVSKNYGHQHPLVLLNEEQLMTNQSGTILADCSRCGEKVPAPWFGCAEDCGFYLHKVCAGAPLELNHPFHQDHLLALVQNPTYLWKCDFCDKEGEKFVYHCSCGLNFHIKCALFTFNIAQNMLKELEHVALDPPKISTRKEDKELEDVRKCFVCWEPLANYEYFSPNCGFNLHKKCAELPLQMNHMFHHKHPLVLQFNSQRLSCKIYQDTFIDGFVYGCRPSWHKCDGHSLKLTDHHDNNYSESHYCDICEESRDPNRWFYCCTTCDTSAHVDYVLGRLPSIKLGNIYEGEDHPHSLSFVKKSYYYPDCDECGKPCEDLALECTKSECNYIGNWECVAPNHLRWQSTVAM